MEGANTTTPSMGDTNPVAVRWLLPVAVENDPEEKLNLPSSGIPATIADTP
jgi:hypothetical protein